jgi:mannose-1-phosphate guanylyltransferase
MQLRYAGKTNTALEGPNEEVAEIFEAMPDISIDYGLMEKASNVVVARALFSWDDVGSWDSLERVRQKDESGNIVDGASALVSSSNSIIINNSTGNKMVVGGVGLDNMIVVVTDDAVLICPKERVQEVKKCVEKLKKENGEKWL